MEIEGTKSKMSKLIVVIGLTGQQVRHFALSTWFNDTNTDSAREVRLLRSSLRKMAGAFEGSPVIHRKPKTGAIEGWRWFKGISTTRHRF